MNKESRLAALALMSSLVVASCGGGSSNDEVAPPVEPPPPPAVNYVVRNVEPATINAGATSDSANDYHVVIPPVAGTTPANKLFVFLPGTDGVPNLYELILKAGARRGYHTIGLAYPNPKAVGMICAPGNSTDPNCFYDVRNAVINGGTTPDITVDNTNSIVTRLTQAVAYLNATYPSEGWGQYLTNGVLNWSKVVVGGHSQGGGHAGVMSKQFTMSRACYFASPPDWDTTNNQPAAWESMPNLTPVSVQYGFGGLQDPSVPWAQLQVIWQTIGLAGPVTQVDATTAPYGNSHMLTTNAAPDDSTTDIGTPLHGLTVRDAFTPLTSTDTPVFDPVWGYMCFQ